MTTPAAFCPHHNRALEFRRCYWTRLWKCECPDCTDGEPDGETGFMRALNVIGHGVTPLEALESYAEGEDVDVAELTVTEAHV